MTRRSKREIERRLDELKENESPSREEIISDEHEERMEEDIKSVIDDLNANGRRHLHEVLDEIEDLDDYDSDKADRLVSEMWETFTDPPGKDYQK
jgi:gas vesicle protein